VIVADTGAVLALVDADDRHHPTLREAFEARPEAWVFPWAILPEVDYLLITRLGIEVAQAFREDVAEGRLFVEGLHPSDLLRALELERAHRALKLGLVDTVVMATAERLRAEAIATLDLRHFGVVSLDGAPALWPRDL
jgi:predicted nucleic acid-binding protein